MILDTPTRTLEIVLGEAANGTPCDIIACYATSSPTVFSTSASALTSNGTTPVTVVPAPAAGTQAQVNEVRLFNKDTITHTVYLRLNDAGTVTVIYNGSAEPNAPWVYAPYAGVTGPPGPQGPIGPVAPSYNVPFVGAAAGQSVTLPATPSAMLLIIQGLVESPTEYSVSGTTLVIPPGLVWDGAECQFVFS